MKRDINLFTAYKNGSAKIGEKSNAGLLLLILVFIFIIAASYGGLVIYQRDIEERASVLNAQNRNAGSEQRKLEVAIERSNLLGIYNDALIEAKAKFDSSVFLTSDKLDKIADALPKTVTVESMKINPQSVRLSCICKNPLDPAQFTRDLNLTLLFSSVTYDGVVYDQGRDEYRFNINCIFNEAQKGRAD
jgi:Tfp pilus assembly protein PilN